jgi:HK97 family phage prohead protease
MERKSFALTGIQLKAEGAGGFKGYASMFGNLDQQGDIVLPGAFGSTLEQFRRDGFVAWSHDWESPPIGFPIDAREDGHGLLLEAAFHDTPRGQEARRVVAERAERGLSMGLSIGYEIRPGGSEQTAKGRLLRDLTLHEVSLTPTPANRLAEVITAKAAPAADPLRAELLALRARVYRNYRSGPAMSRAELIELRNRCYARMIEQRYGRGGRR